MQQKDAGRHLYRILALVALHADIIPADILHGHSIPGGTVLMAAAVIGAAALMIYSK